MSTGQETMAPDFWDPGTLGTIKKFLPEDKSGIILYNYCYSLLDDAQSRAVEDKFKPLGP